MTLVVDASVVVAALLDSGPDGHWAEECLARAQLCAPHLMPVEAANIIRRAGLSGEVSRDVTTLAHHQLLALRCELFAYEPLAERAWALRANLTTYDACYVALAEALECELATLDFRLARATGPQCRFSLPPTWQVSET